MKYEHLVHEINVSKLLFKLGENTKGHLVRFPKIISSKITKKLLFFEKEYVEGQTLSSLYTEDKIKIIKNCLDFMKDLSGKLDNATLPKLPKRRHLFIALSSPYYFIKSIAKDSGNIKLYLYFAYLFFIKYVLPRKVHDYILAHRDLHDRNIIVTSEGMSVIIDPEICVLSEKETDLAIVARVYSGSIPNTMLTAFINEFLKNDQEKNTFLGLTIFYAMQTLALTDKKSPDYIEAKNYLKFFFKEIKSSLKSTNGPDYKVARSVKEKPTVSVGIPAYNEGENISHIIKSIVSQVQKTYVLEKIIIVGDGCTDNTQEKVESLKNEYPFIESHFPESRKGQARRLSEIYQINQSDYIVTFDADIKLKDNCVIENLIEKFSPEIALVVGKCRPTKPTVFLQKLIYAWKHLWSDICENYKGGDNVYNVCGPVVALEKSFSKSLNYPKGITSAAKYAYLFSKLKNLKFAASSAIVYYQMPKNIEDYAKQLFRARDEKKLVSLSLGNWIYDEYKIPKAVKFKYLSKKIVENPILTISSAFFHVLLNLGFGNKIYPEHSGVWDIAPTTKTIWAN